MSTHRERMVRSAAKPNFRLASCWRVVVMKGGTAVEQGPASSVFATPQHPYTRALFAAAFDLEADAAGAEMPGARKTLVATS